MCIIQNGEDYLEIMTHIDVNKLEKELVSALEADRRYARENDAKFRAVHQRVATYEEFRDIVKASHLTSLDRDDVTGKSGRKQPWNPLAASSPDLLVGGGAHSSNHGNMLSSETVAQLPSNGQDFLREWRKLKLSPEEQYKFLIHIGGYHLGSLFKVEISMGLLGELVEVLNLCFTAEHGDIILDILRNLSRSSRFNISLSFLGKTGGKAVVELFGKLKEMSNSNTLTNLSNDNRTAIVEDLAKLYAPSLY